MNKDVNLNRVRKYVDKITDGLNMKIDHGIKESVVPPKKIIIQTVSQISQNN